MIFFWFWYNYSRLSHISPVTWFDFYSGVTVVIRTFESYKMRNHSRNGLLIELRDRGEAPVILLWFKTAKPAISENRVRSLYCRGCKIFRLTLTAEILKFWPILQAGRVDHLENERYLVTRLLAIPCSGRRVTPTRIVIPLNSFTSTLLPTSGFDFRKWRSRTRTDPRPLPQKLPRPVAGCASHFPLRIVRFRLAYARSRVYLQLGASSVPATAHTRPCLAHPQLLCQLAGRTGH